MHSHLYVPASSPPPKAHTHARCADIAGVIALSFQTIPKARFAAYLNLKDVSAFATSIGASESKESADQITLPVTEDNTSKPNLIQANIRFERTSVLRHVGWHGKNGETHQTTCIELSKIIGKVSR